MKSKQSNNPIDRSKWNKNEDLTGKTFGRLTALTKIGKRANKDTYLFRCACGVEKEMIAYNVVVGKSISCGCYNRETCSKVQRVNKLPVGESARNQLFLHYRGAAKRRKIKFEIDRDFFNNITKEDCHYCGQPPNNTTTSLQYQQRNGEYTYNGIDRIDSSKGYEVDNLVPCCKNCNYAKRNMSYEEFITWIKRIVKFNNDEKKYNSRLRRIQNDPLVAVSKEPNKALLLHRE